MTAAPALWLRCGLCGKSPNLAAVTALPHLCAGAGATVPPRLAKADAVPGSSFILRERPRVTCVIRPGRAGEGFTYTLTCPACRRAHQVRHDRVSWWWTDFLATRRGKGVIYLGRDR